MPATIRTRRSSRMKQTARAYAHCGAVGRPQKLRKRFSNAESPPTWPANRPILCRGRCAACGYVRAVAPVAVAGRRVLMGRVCHGRLSLYWEFRYARGDAARRDALLRLGLYAEKHGEGAVAGDALRAEEPRSDDDEPTAADLAFIASDDDCTDLFDDGDYSP